TQVAGSGGGGGGGDAGVGGIGSATDGARSIELMVYGVEEPGPEITTHLMRLLEARLSEMSCAVLTGLLARNPQFQVTQADIDFVRSGGGVGAAFPASAPEHVAVSPGMATATAAAATAAAPATAAAGCGVSVETLPALLGSAESAAAAAAVAAAAPAMAGLSAAGASAPAVASAASAEGHTMRACMSLPRSVRDPFLLLMYLRQSLCMHELLHPLHVAAVDRDKDHRRAARVTSTSSGDGGGGSPAKGASDAAAGESLRRATALGGEWKGKALFGDGTAMSTPGPAEGPSADVETDGDCRGSVAGSRSAQSSAYAASTLVPAAIMAAATAKTTMAGEAKAPAAASSHSSVGVDFAAVHPAWCGAEEGLAPGDAALCSPVVSDARREPSAAAPSAAAAVKAGAGSAAGASGIAGEGPLSVHLMQSDLAFYLLSRHNAAGGGGKTKTLARHAECGIAIVFVTLARVSAAERVPDGGGNTAIAGTGGRDDGNDGDATGIGGGKAVNAGEHAADLQEGRSRDTSSGGNAGEDDGGIRSSGSGSSSDSSSSRPPPGLPATSETMWNMRTGCPQASLGDIEAIARDAASAQLAVLLGGVAPAADFGSGGPSAAGSSLSLQLEVYACGMVSLPDVARLLETRIRQTLLDYGFERLLLHDRAGSALPCEDRGSPVAESGGDADDAGGAGVGGVGSESCGRGGGDGCSDGDRGSGGSGGGSGGGIGDKANTGSAELPARSRSVSRSGEGEPMRHNGFTTAPRLILGEARKVPLHVMRICTLLGRLSDAALLVQSPMVHRLSATERLPRQMLLPIARDVAQSLCQLHPPFIPTVTAIGFGLARVDLSDHSAEESKAGGGGKDGESSDSGVETGAVLLQQLEDAEPAVPQRFEANAVLNTLTAEAAASATSVAAAAAASATAAETASAAIGSGPSYLLVFGLVLEGAAKATVRDDAGGSHGVAARRGGGGDGSSQDFDALLLPAVDVPAGAAKPQTLGQAQARRRGSFVALHVGPRAQTLLLYNVNASVLQQCREALAASLSWGRLQAAALHAVLLQRMGLFVHQAPACRLFGPADFAEQPSPSHRDLHGGGHYGNSHGGGHSGGHGSHGGHGGHGGGHGSHGGHGGHSGGQGSSHGSHGGWRSSDRGLAVATPEEVLLTHANIARLVAAGVQHGGSGAALLRPAAGGASFRIAGGGLGPQLQSPSPMNGAGGGSSGSGGGTGLSGISVSDVSSTPDIASGDGKVAGSGAGVGGGGGGGRQQLSPAGSASSAVGSRSGPALAGSAHGSPGIAGNSVMAAMAAARTRARGGFKLPGPQASPPRALAVRQGPPPMRPASDVPSPVVRLEFAAAEGAATEPKQLEANRVGAGAAAAASGIMGEGGGA
ncbi:unnamed protein product, partial [Phaeothamnion confervicola]